MSNITLIQEEWACARCTLVNPPSNVICVVCGATHPLPEQTISRPHRPGRDRPREQHLGNQQPLSLAAPVMQQPYDKPCNILERKLFKGSHTLILRDYRC